MGITEDLNKIKIDCLQVNFKYMAHIIILTIPNFLNICFINTFII